MSFNESIRPVPYSPDLTPAEEHLRMSRIVEEVDDFFGHTPWSDSEAAERNYGWPTPPSRSPNLNQEGDQGYIVFLSDVEKDEHGNIVDIRDTSVVVETIEEVKAFENMTREEIASYIGGIATSRAQQDKQ